MHVLVRPYITSQSNSFLLKRHTRLRKATAGGGGVANAPESSGKKSQKKSRGQDAPAVPGLAACCGREQRGSMKIKAWARSSNTDLKNKLRWS